MTSVSTVAEPEEPPVRFYPLEEGLKRARPTPGPLVTENVPDEEWTAFQQALAETSPTTWSVKETTFWLWLIVRRAGASPKRIALNTAALVANPCQGVGSGLLAYS
jgi:hypothetical protein